MDRYAVLQRLTDAQNALLGVAAGAIEAASTQPLTYTKNCIQQKVRVSLDPRIMYRGTPASMLADGTLIGAQFWVCGFLQKLIVKGNPRDLTFAEEVGSAYLAGFASGVPCTILELTMIQQQRFGGSIVGTPARLISTFGLGGMSRGLLMSCGREGIYTAGVLGTCPVFIDKFKARGFSTNQAKMGGAICAGVMSASLSHPMDTVKSCLQGDIEQKTYTSNAGTFRTLWAEGGASRFFSGYLFRTGRMILAVGIMNECKLRLSPLLFPHHFA